MILNIKFIKIAFLLYLGIFLLTSCTRVVYTHEDYMSRIKTKNDALLTFGSPTSKTQEGGLEVWTYILGSGTIGFGNYNNNTGTSSVYGTTLYTNFTREITFIIDGNNVIRWNSRGVDFQKEEVDNKATTWGILGFIGGSTVLMMILSAIID